MPVVNPRWESMQYDGTNGADVVAWLCGTVDLVSDDGTTLVIEFIGSHRTLAVGDWAIAGGGGTGFRGFSTEQTAADYANTWIEVPAPA